MPDPQSKRFVFPRMFATPNSSPFRCKVRASALVEIRRQKLRWPAR